MGKFARSGVVASRTARGPIKTMSSTPDISTYEGAPAMRRDAKSDLFLLAAANMVGEDTFYEGASDRDERFRNLVHTVAIEDFDWLARFVPFLRNRMNMRSASVVAAAEAVAARLEAQRQDEASGVRRLPKAKRTNREIVDSAIQRLDEPAEMLAYWQSRYGSAIPKPVKRGVADAMVRLATEYAAMKYDGTGNAWRLGDIVNLTHPIPSTPWQGDLFAYLLDRRHHPGEVRVTLERLPLITTRRFLESIPAGERRDYLRSTGADQVLATSGVTWEWLSGWLPGGMDAEAWEWVIPQMGIMAIIRNLRNFDDAGVGDIAASAIRIRLTNPDEILRSKQFPFRFWNAHKASAGSMRWGLALSHALDLSTSNIPEFDGRTLVLVDSSGSMLSNVSSKSTTRLVEAAAVFGAAVAKRNAGRVDLVHFANYSEKIDFSPSDSVLTIVDRVVRKVGSVGYGTEINEGLNRFCSGHDRVIVFSDMQVSQYARWPKGVTSYAWNLAGYAGSLNYDGSVVELGGMSDAAFRLIPMIEAGRSVDWPF